MIELLRKQLVIDEGYRTKPYTDTEGKLTIGIGRNLTDRGLSGAEVAFLFDNDTTIAEQIARKYLGDSFDRMNQFRQAVVCNMCFQLGDDRFSLFKQTIWALREQRYAEAAQFMRDSKVAKYQSPERWKRHADLMEKGSL